MSGGKRAIDKMKFKYPIDWRIDEEERKFPVRRPRIEIIFRKNSEMKNVETNPEFRTTGLVDSGADICLLPRQIADILKIDLTNNKKEESIGANGKFTTYKTQVYLEIVYKNMSIGVDMVDVSIPEKDPEGIVLEQNILLGRSHLFKKYEITFNEHAKTMIFKRIAQKTK